MKITAGKFTMDVWEGGHPVWCHLTMDGLGKGEWEDLRFSHRDLADLLHVVTRSIAEAKRQLPEKLRLEVE